jgi:hypothetical protein
MGETRLSGARRPARLPLWPKIAASLWVAALVPAYVGREGPGHLLWFCDLALLALVPALWLESALVASMAAVGSLAILLAWNLDFAAMLLGVGPKLTGYLFDDEIPLAFKGLTLFHVWLPWALLWLAGRLGYDRRALRWQTLLAWAVLPLSWWASLHWVNHPPKNINWSTGPLNQAQEALHPALYLAVAMAVLPLAAFVPAHLALKKFFPEAEEI